MKKFIEFLIILITYFFFSTVSGWVFVSAFAFLVGVSIGITSYVIFCRINK